MGDNQDGTDFQAVDAQLYDPVFVILLCAQMVADCQPSSALGWVQLFRTNAISLLIRSLSSKDEPTRDMSLLQVASIAKSLEVGVPGILNGNHF